MIPSDGTEPGPAPRTAEVTAPDHQSGEPAPAHRARPGHTLSRAEFGAHFESSWRILWCAAVSVVRDRTLAQDVVQQAAIVGLQRISDFDTRTSFVSWMVRIVKNIALNEARKLSRRRTHATETGVLDARQGAAGVEREHGSAGAALLDSRGVVVADQDEFDDQVVRALDGLDETARGCLLLRVVLNMTYQEISIALDIPEGTAASHVHRARKAMRDLLRERFVASSKGVRA